MFIEDKTVECFIDVKMINFIIFNFKKLTFEFIFCSSEGSLVCEFDDEEIYSYYYRKLKEKLEEINLYE